MVPKKTFIIQVQLMEELYSSVKPTIINFHKMLWAQTLSGTLVKPLNYGRASTYQPYAQRQTFPFGAAKSVGTFHYPLRYQQENSFRNLVPRVQNYQAHYFPRVQPVASYRGSFIGKQKTSSFVQQKSKIAPLELENSQNDASWTRLSKGATGADTI